MDSGKKVLLAPVAAIVMVVVTGTGARQNQPPSNDQAQSNLEQLYGQYPAVDFLIPGSEATDAKTRTKKLSKNNRYDKKHIVSNTPGKGLAWFGNDWDAGLSGIPASQSDAVVVGEVLDAHAYLSQDKGAVYSEFTVRVGEVLKDKASTQLSPGCSITVDRFGGVVRYGREHSVLYRAVGQDLPRAGRHYLLFLKSTGEDKDYSITLGYELRSDKVFLLDEIPATTPYKGMDAPAFLNRVKDALARSGN